MVSYNLDSVSRLFICLEKHANRKTAKINFENARIELCNILIEKENSYLDERKV